ncbi:MAG TPA: RibD family protein [Chloroflexota bacterium]|jgi:5-amino-6-(5-phosphoribosylamino)uracil reductase/diaminohydroxyphosphoribosylaminopyrimidine deaminase/5-amino-6-(5-phosphoribosylamino)uracil reductase
MRDAAPDLPWVTIKYAQTLDGRIATRTGESQWISSRDSLVYAHELRASHDAILVGVGTVLRDNPRLTVRLVAGANPLRVVADSALRTPLDKALLDPPSDVLLAATAAADPDRRAVLEALGVQILTLPTQADGRVDLQALLLALAARGVRSVLVEGGAEMITALLRQRLAHRLVVCVAPKVLGMGVEGVGDLGIARLDDALAFRNGRFWLCGADVLFEGDVEGARPAGFPAPSTAPGVLTNER